VGVIVLRGEGRAFTAGADASPSGAMKDRSANLNREELLDEMWGQFFCLWDAPKPVIAQVHGYCLGVGTIMSSFADIVIVAEDAEIGWPSLPLGGGVEDVIFAFHVGARKAKEYAFQTGSRLDGREAYEIGWANRVVPVDQQHDTVQRMAARMALTPPGLLRLEKESINRVVDNMGFRDAMRVSAMWCVLSHTDPGVAAVLERMRAQGIKATIAEFGR
jgi:enoyl-CoA hydratase